MSAEMVRQNQGLTRDGGPARLQGDDRESVPDGKHGDMRVLGQLRFLGQWGVLTEENQGTPGAKELVRAGHHPSQGVCGDIGNDEVVGAVGELVGDVERARRDVPCGGRRVAGRADRGLGGVEMVRIVGDTRDDRASVRSCGGEDRQGGHAGSGADAHCCASLGQSGHESDGIRGQRIRRGGAQFVRLGAGGRVEGVVDERGAPKRYSVESGTVGGGDI